MGGLTLFGLQMKRRPAKHEYWLKWMRENFKTREAVQD